VAPAHSERADVPSNTIGATVELRYVARAGLLPELSRQTYDQFYKAAREAVLNAIDADATRIDLDFSRLRETGEFVIEDDGSGMSIHDFCDQFMSLGGSSRFGHESRFGRIGIGSVALLNYGGAAVIETKRAGAAHVVRACVEHPWSMVQGQRRAYLGDLRAGTADEIEYDGSRADHFTRVRVLDARPELRMLGEDPAAFYSLVDKLRRVLPLPWSESAVIAELKRTAPDLIEQLQHHVAPWAAPIYIHSAWERNVPLTRRLFGDDPASTESWLGAPSPVRKRLRVTDDHGSREITVLGFLVSQRRASTSWSGLTARVQNVAVEEQTFFDVTADPGFRKYITGDVWLTGDLDREHLINIDRSTFNRECADYRVVQRYMSRAILDFKSKNVQRPQRLKVSVRRRVEAHRRLVRDMQSIIDCAVETADLKTLPSSERSMIVPGRREGFGDVLRELGAEVVAEADLPSRTPYALSVTGDGSRVLVHTAPGMIEGTVRCRESTYTIVFARGHQDAPCVIVRNRPRQIIFNRSHPAFARDDGETQLSLSFALEIAYLLTNQRDPADLYGLMAMFIDAL
jgi:hypothetical protein